VNQPSELGSLDEAEIAFAGDNPNRAIRITDLKLRPRRSCCGLNLQATHLGSHAFRDAHVHAAVLEFTAVPWYWTSESDKIRTLVPGALLLATESVFV
jgi:hypothetical protein